MAEEKSGSGTVIFLRENGQGPLPSSGIGQGGGLSAETIRVLWREALQNDHLMELIDRHGIRLSDASLYLQFGLRGLGEPGWCVHRGREDRFRIFIRGNLRGSYDASHVEILPSLLPFPNEDREPTGA